jgi:hypothetical protein
MEKPIARIEELVTQEINGELLVYDVRTNKAHQLTETAAFVWKNCDGTKSIEDIRKITAEHFKADINQDFILLALHQLAKNDLLKNDVKGMPEISRREVIKRIGLATMIALPIVASLSVPNTALAALSCIAQPCGPTIPCAPPCVCNPGRQRCQPS